MAVVLPVHNHIDFSEQTEQEYDRQCQKEEEERQSDNDFATTTVAEDKKSNVDDDSSRLYDGKKEFEDLHDDHSMEVEGEDADQDRESDAQNEPKGLNPTALPAFSLEQDGTSIDTNSGMQEREKIATSDDWSMQKKSEVETREGVSSENEIENAIDDNATFIDSLMAVDLADTNNDTSIMSPLESGRDSPDLETTAMTESKSDYLPPLEDPQENIGGLPLLTSAVMEVETEDIPPIEDAISTALTIAAELEIDSALEPPTKESPYGGLENLGNTCYMASALQLLCGLDSFPADLKASIPPQNNDDEHEVEESKEDLDNSQSGEQSVRDALLNVMDRLGKGETVRPDKLKRCIDSRTSLFLGYRQQDAHEFLTTLLDIIDEDYKKKEKLEESREEIGEPATMSDEEKDAENNTESEDEMTNFDSNNDLFQPDDVTSKDGIDEDGNDENPRGERESSSNYDNDTDSVQDRLPVDSPFKRQKVVEDENLTNTEKQTAVTNAVEDDADNLGGPSIQKSISYSEFKFSDIESLLHDQKDSCILPVPSSDSSPATLTTRQDEPKYKLAGGRMSTAGVELTRLEEDGDVRHTGASLESATPEQQIVEDEHYEARNEEEEEGKEIPCSPVDYNFTTKVRVCLTCESCKFRRSHMETYLHLSLDISSESNGDDDIGCPSPSSIEDGLRKFFAPEKREIKCEKCFHTSALQTSEITQLPKNLLFHLKRFIVDISPDYSSISYRKDQSSVSFDERMEIEASVDENERHADDEEGGLRKFLAMDCSYAGGAAYEIRSVVNHIGSSASCGHYTADAKRLKKQVTLTPTDDASNVEDGETSNTYTIREDRDDGDTDDDDGEDRQWTRFNDCYVTRISSKEAVNNSSKTAYMIMYELV